MFDVAKCMLDFPLASLQGSSVSAKTHDCHLDGHVIRLSLSVNMAAHLSYGRVNLNILREAARKDLREFLDKCAGSKV